MAAPLPGNFEATRMREFRQELDILSKTVIQRAKPRLKELGGAYGRYNRALQENTEKIIFATSQLTKSGSGLSNEAQKILEATMSYMDRSAIRTRMTIRKSLEERSLFERKIYLLDRAMEDAKEKENKEELQRLEKLRARLVEEMSLEDRSRQRMRSTQEDFLIARTDYEREAAQARASAIIRADEILLQMTIKQRKKLEAEGNKNAELFLKRERDLATAIESNKKLQSETLGLYKAGIKGFAGEILSKSFTGGLIGALFKGQGFAELVPNIGMALLERSGVLDKFGGGMATFLLGTESEAGRKATQAGAETANIVAQGSQDMSKLAEAGLNPGSIYTHDLHLEKVLADIGKALMKDSVQPSGAGAAVVPGVADAGMPKKKGIIGLLSGVATGVKKFASKDIFKGALGMLSVGTSLAPFATALVALSSVPVTSLLAAIAAVGIVATAVIVFGKFKTQIVEGAMAMAAIGVALIPAALAFNLMGSIDTGSLFGAIGAILAISGIVAILGLLVSGPQAAIMVAGAAALAVLGLALMPFALSLMLLGSVNAGNLTALGGALMSLIPPIALLAIMGPLLTLAGLGMLMLGTAMIPMALAVNLLNPESVQAMSTLLTAIATTAPMLVLAAFGIAALSASLILFGTATAIATGMIAATQVASAFASFFGMGTVSVLDQLFGLAQVSGQLMQTATALNMIASAIQSIATAFGQLGNSEAALETIEQIISLDATQIQTLQDVSMAMDRIMSANQQLRGENQAAQIGAAAGAGAGGAIAISTNSNASTNALMLSAPGRSTDPSVLFSGERYYSMIYR